MADEDKGKGNLHTQEEFGKAKRNLLWFCSLSVVLWLVHAPDGDITAPMLGAGAKVSAYALRMVVWVACVYCLVGFIRQARNVDRLNSELLYTEQFESIDARLTRLSDKFQELVRVCEGLDKEVRPAVVWQPADINTTRLDVREGIDSAVREFVEKLKLSVSSPNKTTTLKSLVREWQEAEKGIELAVERNFRILTEGNDHYAEQAQSFALVAAQELEVARAVLEIRTEFQKLNQHIRGEHRFMYTWYDKNLSYLMFAVATLATFSELVAANVPTVFRGLGDLLSFDQGGATAWLNVGIGVVSTLLAGLIYIWANTPIARWRARIRIRRALKRAHELGDYGAVVRLQTIGESELTPIAISEVNVIAESLNLKERGPQEELEFPNTDRTT